MPRRRRPTAREGADGLWHVWVTVGQRPNGRPLQRHIKRASRQLAEDAADDLLDDIKAGRAKKPGAKPTLQEWMHVYLTDIAPERCIASTLYDYESKMRSWVYPAYGAKRIDRLEPEDLDRIYSNMRRAGKAQSSRLKVHRILSRALEVAYRRGHVSRNVAKLIDAPTVYPVSVKALGEELALKILDTTAKRRNPERWSLALALGLRQGEALGLRWEDPEDGTPLVDLERGLIRVWYQLRREIYRHGCGKTCGRKRGADCPRRSGEGLGYRKCKGKSQRTIPLPPELIPAFTALRKRQAAERLAFGAEWVAGPAVFTTADGRLIDPRDDYDEWVSILAEAGVRHVKPHIMRHTAATLLLRQGVDIRVVQQILGHRDPRTTGIYTQDVDELMLEAVKRTVLSPRKPKKDESKIKGVPKGVLRRVV